MVDVNQADRDAAALLSEIECDDPRLTARMRSGELDTSLWVQAFTRARTEATAELVEALRTIAHGEIDKDVGYDQIVTVEMSGEEARGIAAAALAKHLTDGPGLTERLEMS